ncbi:uncharacterized protein B0T15DRAFT_216302 [Chaetomium strumarium]|uniref:Cytochrome c oxidase assembly protein COX20, mitochondrial n=1 Tax=Chaetomium strumarium TaxID=1170767 RepID=A0AAJ0GTQ8_9PEZI|nr:hypothetical protein B0T15DRAFT_216302 [Chaetomium strumarium]
MPTPQSTPRDQTPPDPSRSWVHPTDQSHPTISAPSPPPTPTAQPPTQQQQQQQPQPQPHRKPTLADAAATIKPSDFLTFHQAPCARTGLLTGIGAGAAVGVLRWIQGKPIPKAANWAVGAGVLASLGQYEYCQFQRYQERAKVRRVVEVYAAQQARERKERAEQQEEEERRRRREREEEEERRRRRAWWRFW